MATANYLDMDGQATLGQIIMGAAIASVPHTGQDLATWTRQIIKRAMTIDRDFMRPDSPAQQALGSVKLEADITEIKFEQNTKRYLICFQTTTGRRDKGEEGEAVDEEIRTYRVDGAQGDLVEAMLKGIQAGDHVMICKANEEGKDGKKYRVCPYLTKIPRRTQDSEGTDGAENEK